MSSIRSTNKKRKTELTNDETIAKTQKLAEFREEETKIDYSLEMRKPALTWV